jgi:hypothetical protein
MGKGTGAFRVLLGNLRERDKRPRHRWEDNIKMDIQEIGWEAWTRLLKLKTGTGGRLL